jgi:exonuclease III
MYCTKIASININGITANTRTGMLLDFIRRHDLDLAFVQEVADPSLLELRGYITHSNFGASMRGTAIMAKLEIPLTDIIKLPSWRAIAASHKGVHLVNLYAPSGTTKRAEKEYFFNTEIAGLFLETPGPIIVGVDFNCVLQQANTRGMSVLAARCKA